MARRQRNPRQLIIRLDDDELCRAVAQGDDHAFAELTSRHREWLVGLCRRNLRGDAHRAEDIAQECFIKLHAVLQRDHRPLKPRAWLSVVARNACIDVHRTTHAEPTDELNDTGVDAVDPFEADSILAEAWEGLAGRHREVLQHRELMGLSYDEIAVAMDTTVSAVETLLYRARAALRRNYRQAGGQLLGCGLFGLSFMRLLDTGVTPELDAHLASCAACTGAAARLAETTDLLRVGTAQPVGTAELAMSPLRARVVELVPTMSSLGSGSQSAIDALSGSGSAVAAVAAAVAVSGGLVVASGVATEPPYQATTTTTTTTTITEEEPAPMLARPSEMTIVVPDVPKAFDAGIGRLAPPSDRRWFQSEDDSTRPMPTPEVLDETEPCEPSDTRWSDGFDEEDADSSAEWQATPSTIAAPPEPCRPGHACESDRRCESPPGSRRDEAF